MRILSFFPSIPQLFVKRCGLLGALMLFACALVGPVTAKAADEDAGHGQHTSIPTFQGQIVYQIKSDGVTWHYTCWIKGEHVRTQLKQGNNVFGNYIFDLKSRTAFRVDDHSKTYAPAGPLGRPMMGHTDRERRRERERHATRSYDAEGAGEMILGYPTVRVKLEGRGPSTEVWMCRKLGPMVPAFLPNFKSIGDKLPVLSVFLNRDGGFLMKMVQKSWRGSVLLQMEAIAVKPEPIELAKVTLPSDYQGIGGLTHFRSESSRIPDEDWGQMDTNPSPDQDTDGD